MLSVSLGLVVGSTTSKRTGNANMPDHISRRTALSIAAVVATLGCSLPAVRAEAPASAPVPPPDDKPQYWISAIAVSHDGRLAAASSTSRAIGIWELASGQLIKQLEFPASQNSTGALAFAPDGKRLYAGNAPRRRRNQGKALLEFEIETGTIVNEASVEPNWVNKIAVHANADWIATAGGGFDRSLRLWTVSGLYPHRIWPAHDSAVVALAISPDGKLIASGGGNSVRSGRDPSVRLWDARTGQQLHKLRGHTQSIADLVFTQDGRRLVSLSGDAVQAWDVKSARLLSRIKLSDTVLNAKTLSPDGRWFASNTYGESEAVALQAVASGKVLHRWTSTNRHIDPIVVTPDSGTLLIGGADDTVEVRSAADGRLIRSLAGLVGRG
jgi:WD40 repeat protein